MTRKNDVEALLREAKVQYESVCESYEKALRDETLDLRTPVKNLMENLRSALDYMAHDVYELCCQSARVASGKDEPRNIYFPYGRTKNDFRSGVGRSLPGLDTLAPNVYDLISSIQPFQCGDDWLSDFCSILNEKKHDRLTAQIRSKTETYTVRSKGGSVSIQVNNPDARVTSMPGAVKIFGMPAQLTDMGIHTAPSNELKHERTKWVAFRFEGTNVNVLGLLNKAFPGIAHLAESLYQQVG